MTRIWTLSMKRSQLRSDKVSRIWTSHVKDLRSSDLDPDISYQKTAVEVAKE